MKINNKSISDNLKVSGGWLHRLNIDDADLYFTSRGDSVNDDDPYSGFNVCHYSGDRNSHIDYCRKMLCETFGFEDNSLIIPRQTHSSNVMLIDKLPVDSHQLDEIDGLVTNLKNVIIGVSTADCVPVALWDSAAGVYGIAHAGWRGAINGIIENTLDTMLAAGAKINQIKAFMGPSICVECFEVGEEVAAAFPENCVERMPQWEKPHVNLQKYISEKLRFLGIKTDNISDFDRNLCTKCHPSEFFSARVLGVKSGRIFTFLKV